MITRIYKTKSECAQCWVNECWDMLDSRIVTEAIGWKRRWKFLTVDEDGKLVPYSSPYTDGGVPAWNTWFEPSSSFDREWIESHLEEVANLGFVLVYHNDEFWGLAIDGGGYSFHEVHWLPLYEARGLKWHDED